MKTRIISTQIGEPDEKNLKVVQEYLGTEEQSQAVRFSLKLAAEKIKKILKL